MSFPELYWGSYSIITVFLIYFIYMLADSGCVTTEYRIL